MELIENEIFSGRYRLIEQIGLGGFSEVWKAADQMVNDQLIALKVFASEKGLDELGLKLFRQEYGNMLNLTHGNLLKVLHFDIWQGRPFLVLPFCSRGSLANKLVLQGKFSEKEVAQVLFQLSSALTYLHKNGIIHQDIKPENVLIDENGDYLLTDFGISSNIRNVLRHSVVRQSAMTIAYAAPERFSSNPKPLLAGDIFSLGTMAFQLCTGDVPFGEQGGLVLFRGAEIPIIECDISERFKNIVYKCMSLNPNDRLTAKLLEEYCKNYIENGFWKDIPGARTTEVIPKNMGDDVKQDSFVPEEIEDHKKPINKRKKRLIAIFSSVLFLILLGGFLAYYFFIYQPKKEIQNIEDRYIGDGNSYFKQKEFSRAINSYRSALHYDTNNIDIKNKIEACENSIKDSIEKRKLFEENESKRKILITTERIDQRKRDSIKIVQEQKKLKQLEEEYRTFINTADENFADLNISKAKSEYENALRIKPGDLLAQTKINEINSSYFIWSNPSVTEKYAVNSEIVSVEIYKNKFTKIKLRFVNVKDNKISIYDPRKNKKYAFYIKAAGQELLVKSVEGIGFVRDYQVPTDNLVFTLVFDAISPETYSFDLIEGKSIEAPVTWNFKGIHLK